MGAHMQLACVPGYIISDLLLVVQWFSLKFILGFNFSTPQLRSLYTSNYQNQNITENIANRVISIKTRIMARIGSI